MALADGSVRNAYTFKISNMTRDPREYVLTADGLAGATIAVAGAGQEGQTDAQRLTAAPDMVATYRIFVTAPRAALQPGSQPLSLTLTSTTGETVSYQTVFMGPTN